MPAFHVSPLAGHSHEQRTLFTILVGFWWPMVNNELYQFIRTCEHCQLVNSCSQEAQQLLKMIESDAPFYVVFIDFWETGKIQDSDGSRKILTCLDCITGFGLESPTEMKEITSDQASR